eukprot:CAMPEP_0178921412 /NCGR_PEP_ID=MMETSP0786-20121207/15548_1 /TAXON_ID=186022 /ORGANISM="Thalassionema frauenfeldii, Strain CCMP 1798" /LENGTH=140 /DNA_ID=CAMNT_0020595591 /DNA_START=100 /DNA_END=522 /DNA_ORIENTATION=+
MEFDIRDEKENANCNEKCFQKAMEPRVSNEMYQTMYQRAELELEESAKAIEELKTQLEDTVALLNVEKGRSRRLQAVNKRLERDIDRITFDHEELYKESEISEHLLETKNKEIESLVAQINLLVQIGTMKEKDPACTLKS